MLATSGIDPDAFAAAMAALPVPVGARGGGLIAAVSGGADSTALMLCADMWARRAGRPLTVVSIDHGLRAAAADEARKVARLCADRGIACRIVTLGLSSDVTGNVQQRAREARYAALQGVARETGSPAILLGHTADDQAETVLMRLIRGSGVDGLAGMRPARALEDATLLRPLLGFSRAQTEATCRAAGVDWVCDPSNDDPAYTRVRIRRLRAALAEEGLGTDRLLTTAAHMRRAQGALDAVADAVWQDCVSDPGDGTLTIDRAGFAALAEEPALRLLSRAVQRVGARAYRPRFEAITAVLAHIRAGGGGARTAGGCLIRAEKTRLRVLPEQRRS